MQIIPGKYELFYEVRPDRPTLVYSGHAHKCLERYTYSGEGQDTCPKLAIKSLERYMYTHTGHAGIASLNSHSRTDSG